MPTDASELRELLLFARHLARSAGEVIMPFYRSVAIELKPDGTEVTEADRRAEAHIREEIRRRDPGAKVLGEEFGGERRPLPGDQWVVDPLDGTASFVLGLPTFGTLIGLLRDGEPVIGVVHMPALEETVWAAKGDGCWFAIGDERPQRLQCEAVGSLASAFVSVGGLQASILQPIDGVRPYALDRVIARAKKFRVVSDCVQHVLLCRRRLHVAIDPLMEPWDSAALVPCVREAGGTVSSLSAATEDVVFAGSLLSTADAALHREVVSLLTGRSEA